MFGSVLGDVDPLSVCSRFASLSQLGTAGSLTSTSTNRSSNEDFDGLAYPASGDALLLLVGSPLDVLTSFNEPCEKI